MEKIKIETRISSKDRLCYLLPFIGAILVGLLYYVLVRYFDQFTIFSIISLIIFIYTVICELAIKALKLFWARQFLILPLGVVVVYVLNVISPRIFFTPVDQFGVSYSAVLWIVLVMLCMLVGGLGTIVTRVVRGYEALAGEPEVIAFSTNWNYDDVFSLLKDFLFSLSLDYDVIVKNNSKSLRFFYRLNRYRLFLDGDKKGNSFQITFVAVGLNKDTLVEPDSCDSDLLMGYFETYFKQRTKDEDKIELISDFKSKISDTLKIEVWKNLTLPLSLKDKLAERGLQKQKIMDYISSHKKGIISFIITVVIAQLLINYISRLLGIG